MKNFLPLFGRTPDADPTSALAALTEKSNAAIALADSLTAKIEALTTERDGATASLTEALAQLNATQLELTASREAFEALESSLPEKVKALATDLAASAGIPAGQTPPLNPTAAATPERPTLTLDAFQSLPSNQKMAFSVAGGRLTA